MRKDSYEKMAKEVEKVVNVMGFNPIVSAEALDKELNHPYEVYLFRMVCEEYLRITESKRREG